ncbi:NAD-dependent epimerase/dehydratase family protein [Sediminispirochaeta bajacaliforniensis]|uniref:NAD-dependent epimerase/dehydratase family protein n=1 Tax=Sediminispirochaeta bajacaliforniensis TaxID=148 RepID=UPI00035E34CD|nr:GDP-mannose 4,6-dehydratase [Sediminispirochaeta bajacaliforniensis]
MNLPKVMVTGGSGFIGSHLIDALLPDHEVYVFDIVPLDKAPNLMDAKDHPHLHYTVGDIRDPAALRAFWIPDAEVMYHLASVVGIKNYIADPLTLIDISVIGTRHLLEIAREYNTKVLFTSTSEIYGKNPAIPWDEAGDRVLGPTSIDRWSYSSAKAVCEHMLYGIHRASGLPFTIVRFFNAYGPRQNPFFVVSQSVYKALRGEEPLLYDDGKMTRCFTYISDIVQGIIAAAKNPKAVGEAFNLGNSVETTMKEVIETVIQETNNGTSYRIFDTQKEYGKVYEDIPRRVPKVSKADEVLHWKATIQVREGIRRTIEWARKNEWWLEDGRNT